jgi:uncharacterized glyoxalase superfamily protein PhnB
MNPVFNTYHPDGFSTVNGYLFVSNPQELIDFLKEAFYAEEKSRSIRPDNGDIGNCILKIGESCFMISQASGPFEGMRGAFYFYVNDVDAIYQRAIDNGAKSVFEAADMDYGDRQAGIEDVSGNYWWISRRLEEGDYKSS